MAALDIVGLMNNVRAFWQARMILTANELNLASTLPAPGATGLTGQEVAAALSTDLRATALLLDGLVAIGLVEKDGQGRYTNSPIAARHMAADGERPIRDGLWHMSQLWHSWSQLTDCVRSGRPATVEGERTIEQYHQFVGAMYDHGFGRAKELARTVPLPGARRLLDLGGGPGSYAMCFAAANDDLQATVFDRPPALDVAKQKIEKHGLTDRVELVAGDFLHDDIGTDWDVVFMSHIIHSYDEATNVELIRTIASRLAPGGRLLLQDFFCEDSRVEPANSAVFALNMLVNTEAGQTYTFAEATAWLRAAGFVDIERLETPPGADVISARTRAI